MSKASKKRHLDTPQGVVLEDLVPLASHTSRNGKVRRPML